MTLFLILFVYISIYVSDLNFHKTYTVCIGQPFLVVNISHLLEEITTKAYFNF